MLNALNFHIGGFFSGYKDIKIWIEDKKMYASYTGDFTDLDNEYTKEISPDEINILDEKLQKSKVGKWKKEYKNYGVMDGTQWSLEYKEVNKRTRHISGSNAYPEMWNLFIEALGDLIPEVLVEAICENDDEDFD